MTLTLSTAPSSVKSRGPAPADRKRRWRNPTYGAIALFALFTGISASHSASAQQTEGPFGFFEGVTDTVGTLKVFMRNPVRTRCISRGEVQPDGSLSLVQRVEDEGSQPYLRHWLVREVGPHHFVGTMSQAIGPVTIDEIGNRYRFRFRMSGSLSVEEWLTPLPGGRSATSTINVYKFGIPVARSQGMVRKI